MPTNNISINYTSSFVSASGVAKGDVVCIIPTDPSQYVLATAANRINCRGLAICIEHPTPHGVILIAYNGEISAADCGLGPGALAPVRISALGRLERTLGPPIPTDEVVGWADTSGNVSFSFPSFSGTLSNLVGSTDSIATLRALPIPTSNYSVMHVLGYYVPGDVGGGVFFWDNSATDPDDNGMVIQPTAGGIGRWRRTWDGVQVNVKWWGAQGDGAIDDTFPIQDMLNFAQSFVGGATNGLICFFPTGIYLKQDGILVGQNFMTFRGEGPNATQFLFSNVTSGFYTNVSLIAPIFKTHCRFEDFSIVALQLNSVGINLTSFNSAVIKNVKITTPQGVGIYGFGDLFGLAPLNNRVENVWVDCAGTGTAVRLQSNVAAGGGFGPGQNVFTDVRISNVTIGVQIESGTGNIFDNVRIENATSLHYDLGTAIVGADDAKYTMVFGGWNDGGAASNIVRTYANSLSNVLHLGWLNNYDSAGGIGILGVYHPASVNLTSNHVYVDGQESANLSLYANTKFTGTFTHTNTANRTYTLQNTSGLVPLATPSTAFTITFPHNNTANRTYDLQDQSGTLPLLTPATNFNISFANTYTAARTHTLQDASGTIPHMAAAQADSVAVLLVTLVSDFNALLAKLRATKVIAT